MNLSSFYTDAFFVGVRHWQSKRVFISHIYSFKRFHAKSCLLLGYGSVSALSGSLIARPKDLKPLGGAEQGFRNDRIMSV
jgi:hypothetical protein